MYSTDSFTQDRMIHLPQGHFSWTIDINKVDNFSKYRQLRGYDIRNRHGSSRILYKNVTVATESSHNQPHRPELGICSVSLPWGLAAVFKTSGILILTSHQQMRMKGHFEEFQCLIFISNSYVLFSVISRFLLHPYHRSLEARNVYIPHLYLLPCQKIKIKLIIV